MPDPGEVEKRDTTWDELRSGLSLRIGQPMVLTVRESDKVPVFELVPDPFVWTDSHGKELRNDETFSLKGPTRPDLAFVEGEHLELGRSMTQTVDAWALAGLIDGGAMIDVKESNHLPGPLDKWEIALPLEGPTDTPGAPYDSIGVLKNAHWHYIVPDPLFQDAEKKVRWTKESLRFELQQGTAAVISFGQLVFVGGDWAASFEDLHKPFLFKPRVNIMEALDKGSALALIVLDVLQNRRAHPFFDLLDLETAAKSEEWTARVNPNIHILLEAFEEIRSAPFGPLQLITNVMASRQMPLEWNALAQNAQWINTRKLEMGTLQSIKIDEKVLSILLTNGAFFDLALHNEPHFAPGNWTAFESGFSRALNELRAHLAKPRKGTPPTAPIPASVLARVGHSLHFLTDAFSSAHMRVPRAALGTDGGIAAKVMHDIDGSLGLVVSNGFNDTWRAYGDKYLHPFGEKRDDGEPSDDEIKKLHEKFVAKSPGAESTSDANYHHVVAAVAEAVCLVHYEAQRLRSEGNAVAFTILDKARSGGGGGFLGDNVAPTGPHFPGAQDWLKKGTGEKLAYLKKHWPIPAPVSTDAAGNHAPLLEAGYKFNSARIYSHRKASHRLVNAAATATVDEHYIQVKFASETYEFDVSEVFHAARLARNAKLPGVPEETVLPRLLLKGSGLPDA